MKIGRFKKVALREIWKHEALDFTNWLADENNLSLLSEELGIELVNAQTEVSVGKFAVDILAEDDRSHKVIIENQLEATNHDHLGKIITYAAGLQAETIIWVVSRARQEHEQAINWLNENTTESANFFLIQLEAWKIDTSAPAPKFNIIAKPNDWAKTIRSTSSSNKVRELQLKQQEFWTKFRDYAEENSKAINSWQKPRPQHWYDISIGSSQAHLSAQVNTPKSEISMNLYIPDNKELYYKIEKDKVSIEQILGFKLRWWELPKKKASIISEVIVSNYQDEEKESECIAWLLGRAEEFKKVFKKYL